MKGEVDMAGTLEYEELNKNLEMVDGHAVKAPEDYQDPEQLYQALIARVRKYHPSADITMIEKAYRIGKEAHKDQVRKSGEPYIIHPLWVGIILAELEMDKETIVAGMLHDVVEDTEMTLDDITREFGKETDNAVYFSRKEILDNGFCLIGDKVVRRINGRDEREVLDINNIFIPGMHNVENYMAAAAAVEGLAEDGIIRRTAIDFKGVPHRIEFIREVDGVKYYNDSIASSPARTTAGLNSFGDKKVILIAGGYDKKIPFDDFGKVVCDHVKALVLVGVTSEKIENAVRNAENFNNLPIYRCTEFKQAAEKAKEVAKGGDTVILSPACASFDLFKNFEERGNTFKNIVKGF
mgnify:CR=1 FL=1